MNPSAAKVDQNTTEAFFPMSLMALKISRQSTETTTFNSIILLIGTPCSNIFIMNSDAQYRLIRIDKNIMIMYTLYVFVKNLLENVNM